MKYILTALVSILLSVVISLAVVGHSMKQFMNQITPVVKDAIMVQGNFAGLQDFVKKLDDRERQQELVTFNALTNHRDALKMLIESHNQLVDRVAVLELAKSETKYAP